MRNHLKYASSLAIALTLWGCGGDIKDSVDRIVEAMDNAVYTLDQNSSEYQNILEELLNQIESIDNEISEAIRGDITVLLERTPGVVGQELRCNVDFIATRIKQGLQCAQRKFMLSNLYSGTLQRPECVAREPSVCSIVPSSIQQEFDPSVINVYGYDFDLGINGIMEDSSGDKLPISEYFAMPSHYNLTINLGDNGIPDVYRYDKLSLLYEDKVIASTSVIRGEVCTLINPGVRTINYAYQDGKPCERDGGGFGGIRFAMCLSQIASVGIDIDTSLSLDYENNRIIAETKSTIDSLYSNRTDTFVVYSSPPGQMLSNVSVEMTDSLEFHDADERVNYIERGNFGLVNQYELNMIGPNLSAYAKIDFNEFEVCTYSQ